ncbi:hypothetical protein DH2020_017783 [Rehmannia glutinosa]|uniref:LOB domain-containing protein n=1 Tax=Rehmannia glutinosa TaxID=99300 RepID=A0ABR0WTJ7_REHGL
MATGSTGSPCGACKFLRRKCAPDCVFAPYFCSEQGPARFAAIHKVFGASNVSKLLLHVPLPDRCEAVVTIAYEAQARIRDPVYGCGIFASSTNAGENSTSTKPDHRPNIKKPRSKSMARELCSRIHGIIISISSPKLHEQLFQYLTSEFT